MHQYTKSDHVGALSIYHQQSLEKKGEKLNRKHILALLSSFTREEAEVKREEIQDLCCFDRMKKLIGRRDVTQEEAEKDQISSIVIEQKINQMENRLNKQLQVKIPSGKMHHRAASSGNFQRRSFMIETVKKDCLHKFLAHQVGKRDKDIDDARRMIDKQVKLQIDDLIQDKGLQLTKLRETNQALNKQIMALKLEIEGLRTRQDQMKEYIEQLEQMSKGRKQTKKHISQNTYSQSFQDKFREVFGDCQIEQLKAKMQKSIDKCLQGFERVQNKNQVVIHEQKKAFEVQCERMQNKINQLQQSENELLGNLRTLKLHKQLSEVEADELGRAKIDLERLQKVILALYTQWYSQRGQGEKKLLKMRGCLNQNYSYEQMVKYMVEYEKKFSTDQKLNDYLFKVLRGIQKLRRTIYPEQCNEKLDPLLALDKIEKWVKLRVEVPTLARRQTSSQDIYFTSQ